MKQEGKVPYWLYIINEKKEYKLGKRKIKRQKGNKNKIDVLLLSDDGALFWTSSPNKLE